MDELLGVLTQPGLREKGIRHLAFTLTSNQAQLGLRFVRLLKLYHEPFYLVLDSVKCLDVHAR